MKRLAALLAMSPLPAMAHHAMDGATPDTWMQGFASGLAHPVIGLDHLTFLLAAGILAAGLGRYGAAAILAFVLAGFAGSLLHLSGIGLGPVEAIVALSVLASGLALLWRRMHDAVFPVALAVAGLFHGHAFGEAIIGAEQAPLAAYLAGLALVQLAVGIGTMLLVRHYASRLPQIRAVGAGAAALMGCMFLALAVAA